jgi:hypothetical protein
MANGVHLNLLLTWLGNVFPSQDDQAEDTLQAALFSLPSASHASSCSAGTSRRDDTLNWGTTSLYWANVSKRALNDDQVQGL